MSDISRIDYKPQKRKPGSCHTGGEEGGHMTLNKLVFLFFGFAVFL
jgi:hypothetical protein